MSFICPAPLVTTDSFEDFTIVALGNCVVPCPTIVYTPQEWDGLTLMLSYLSLISLLLSFSSFVAHLSNFKKYFIQCMLIGGFFLNAFIMCTWLFANRTNDFVCKGTQHYIQHGSFCVAQAAMLGFSFFWVEAWSVIFVVDLYLHVTSTVQAQDIPRLRKIYICSAVVFSCALTIAPLAANNYGFDYEVSVPVCFYMLSNNTGYFWYGLIIPLCLLIIADVIVVGLIVVRLNQVFVNYLFISKRFNNNSVELSTSTMSDATTIATTSTSGSNAGAVYRITARSNIYATSKSGSCG